VLCIATEKIKGFSRESDGKYERVFVLRLLELAKIFIELI
jgi:hypothetical protein